MRNNSILQGLPFIIIYLQNKGNSLSAFCSNIDLYKTSANTDTSNTTVFNTFWQYRLSTLCLRS